MKYRYALEVTHMHPVIRPILVAQRNKVGQMVSHQKQEQQNQETVI